MLARLALVVPAVLIAVLLLTRIGDERACVQAGRDALDVTASTTERTQRDVARRAADRCDDVEGLSAIALALAATGYRDTGEDLLQVAVRRSPRSFVAWSTLARVQLDAGRDAAEARRRARALNPLWRGPAPLPKL